MGEDRGGSVRLDIARPAPGSDQALDELYRRALDCDGGVDPALELAVDLGATSPLPGHGQTLALWERLATVAVADVTVARVVEPHLDALAILAESETSVAEDGSWGVFAAEGPGLRLDAAEQDGGWRLTGRKPWCSLAGRLDHALVTAHTDAGRRLFAVPLRAPGVRVADDRWPARGLSAVPSGPVDFDGAHAVPVGAAGWYLERAGFAWGGIGVAAVWFGAAVGVGRAIRDTAKSREPDQIALMHLGATDAALWAARAALAAAAEVVDRGDASRAEAGLLANRTRTVVADAAERVLRHAAHALGPAPLALDARHARHVADLELYLRQHHAERDEAAIGRALLALEAFPW